ncbi:MAG TPA: nuclear transport factor 2 family protein [Steroidobacteraceae bacterium]|nr:nuclear transport factor 2 family protein [Steroidobacteraceae bacterium]
MKCGKTTGRLKTAMMTLGAIMLTVNVAQASGQYAVTAPANLLDRIQIEDILNNFIWAYEADAAADLAAMFVEDGDVNIDGQKAHGRKNIQQLFVQAGQGREQNKPDGFPMLVTNTPNIVINGNRATVRSRFSMALSNHEKKAAPVLVEQGLIEDVLVKKNGKWLLQERVITTK